MPINLVLLMMAGAVWIAHLIRLVRAPWRLSKEAWIIAAVMLLVGGGAYALWPAVAGFGAAAIVLLLLVVPALLTRRAARALRWGRFGAARLMATSAWCLRPTTTQRVFRGQVALSERLDAGEEIDLDAELGGLAKLSEHEHALHRLALLSWTDDFEAMAVELGKPNVRPLALASGLAATYLAVQGELGGPQAALKAYWEVAKGPAFWRRTVDGSWALLSAAAQLGAVELCEQERPEIAREVPAERIAVLRATARQRAGDNDGAEQLIAAALASAELTGSGRRRLLLRRDRPLTPFACADADTDSDSDTDSDTDSDSDSERALADIRKRLALRAKMAPLAGPGITPLSLALSLSLVAVFFWQLAQQSAALVYREWGLWAPYAAAPDPYRLASYGWLHLDVGHLFLNVLGLLIFGRVVEQAVGKARMLFLYVAGLHAGGLAFVWWHGPLGVAIGASGAVMALFGATVAFIASNRALRRSTLGRKQLALLLMIAVAQIVADLWWEQSAGSAHAGGLLLGLLLGWAFRPRESAAAST